MQSKRFLREVLCLACVVFLATLTAGCADDIQNRDDLPPLTKEDSPDKRCKREKEKRAIEIEHQKNEEPRRRHQLEKAKPVPGLYHPFTPPPPGSHY